MALTTFCESRYASLVVVTELPTLLGLPAISIACRVSEITLGSFKAGSDSIVACCAAVRCASVDMSGL